MKKILKNLIKIHYKNCDYYIYNKDFSLNYKLSKIYKININEKYLEKTIQKYTIFKDDVINQSVYLYLLVFDYIKKISKNDEDNIIKFLRKNTYSLEIIIPTSDIGYNYYMKKIR